MSEKKGNAKAVIVPLIIFVVFALLLTGVNVFAAPRIASNGSAQLLAPLYKVMPEAKGFELIYSADDSAASSLHDVPDTVRSVYSESSGLGYAVTLSTAEGYTKEPMLITMAVDAEGKLSGVNVDVYPDSRPMGEDYPSTYLGQDSALGGVSLVSGVTYSSKAFHNAVSDGFTALIGNELIGAGVKSDAQLLGELLPTLGSGIVNSEGVAQYEEQDISAAGLKYVVSAQKAVNGGMVACIAMDGEKSYLALCNLSQSCRVYDVDSADVTGAVPEELVAEATQLASSCLTSLESDDLKLLKKMVPDGADIAPQPLDGVYSSVTGAYLIDDGGTRLYGFVARPYGYGNLPLTVVYVLDESGAVYAMNAAELILMKEYFTAYTLDDAQYKTGFNGLTADSWSGDQALISGATVTSNAVSTALTDVFNAYAAITTEGGEG